MEFICPKAVQDELSEGSSHGYTSIAVPPWIAVMTSAIVQNRIAQIALDIGEAAVIQLALEQGIQWVCLDDWKGRRAALAVGLNVTGTLGLLSKAKILGLIPSVRFYVEKMNRNGEWYSKELIKRVLDGVGEAD